MKHAMYLSPMPPKLVAFPHVNGADTLYGQLYRNVSNDAYNAADIDGFLPHNQFKGIKALFASIAPKLTTLTFPLIPTLAELNTDLTNGTKDRIQDALFPDEPVPTPIILSSLWLMQPQS